MNRFHFLMFVLIFALNVNAKASENDTVLFPRIDNWEITNRRVFKTDNLYYAINGAAELFLKYNFEAMYKAEYAADSNYISVELYQHKTNTDAFGVYSIERPEEDKYFKIGVQGHGEADYIYFLAGRYYIKIRALLVTSESKEAMAQIAQNFEEEFNQGATFPEIFEAFPKENKVLFSEKYVGQNILGYTFLKNSFEVNYQIGEFLFTVFVLVNNSNSEASQMLYSYFKYLKMEEEIGEGMYVVDDKYNGTIRVLKYGNYLICCRGDAPEEQSKEILNSIKKSLE